MPHQISMPHKIGFIHWPHRLRSPAPSVSAAPTPIAACRHVLAGRDPSQPAVHPSGSRPRWVIQAANIPLSPIMKC